MVPPCNTLPPGRLPPLAPGFKPVFHPLFSSQRVKFNPRFNHHGDGHKHIPLRAPRRGRPQPPTTLPRKQAQRGFSIPAALGVGGVNEKTLPSDQPPRRASAQPSAGVAALVQPPPRPPRRGERSSARPPNRQPLSTYAGPLPCRGAPRRVMLGIPPLPGAAHFRVPRRPRLRRARGGGPRSAAPGSCLRSPLRLGLLPLSPAPPPRAGICELPGPGASPPALRNQRVSASLRGARVLLLPGDPRAPPRRRALRAREPGAPGAWDPAELLPSPRGSAGMQAAL